jgi:predicted 3-demethylubiquinone-9 3-methyltransferase (glyoxalase superfamily)
MQKISPCLWFEDGKAEDAANYYVSIFKNASIVEVMRYGEAGPGPADAVMAITFELDGQRFMGLNDGPFQFSPAVSFFVNCYSQQEVDELWEKLCEGGQPNRCGWLTDKFGVSWQIAPRILLELLQDKDSEKAKRVMQAMMQMDKIDIAKIEEAAAG